MKSKSFLLLLCLLAMAAIIPPKAPDLQFSSRSATNPSQKVTFSISFDDQHNATITVSSSSAITGDKETTTIYNDVQSVSQEEGEESQEEVTVGSGTHWIIPFDDPTPNEMSGNTVIVDCNCTSGNQDADCFVSGMVVNNVFTGTCVKGPGCARCKLNVQNGTSQYTGPALILKANSITIN